MVKFEKTGLPVVIEMRGITQRYGDKTVLNGCDLLIEDKPNQGQFVVLMGISGSGKSTLLRYITGLQEPTEGTVEINGKPRSKEAIATVFQDYSSFPWRTVLENVEFPLEIRGIPKKSRREKAMEMIEKVGLKGHEYKYAQSPTLSGGQLQRVAIARSLIANSGIVLMDEPFGALDSATRHEMQILLADLWETFRTTVVFVTHDEREAVFLGDDIYVLDPRIGKIAYHIQATLPFNRTRETKKMPEFHRLVGMVEDALLATSGKK